MVMWTKDIVAVNPSCRLADVDCQVPVFKCAKRSRTTKLDADGECPDQYDKKGKECTLRKRYENTKSFTSVGETEFSIDISPLPLLKANSDFSKAMKIFYDSAKEALKRQRGKTQ